MLPDAQGRGQGLAKRVGGNWDVGTWLRIPGTGDDQPGGDTGDADSGSSGGGGETESGQGTFPLRPGVQPGLVPDSPNPPGPIPKFDFPQAAPGTDFRAAESQARGQYRANAAASGNPLLFGEQVQHPAKWREGARTNLDPSITNDPDFLHPIQSRVSQMGGRTYQLNGRTFRTDHTYADQGLYPQAAADA